MVVGLTGGIGSGKTTVLNLFKKYHIATYIADIEAKNLMNTSPIIRKKLISEFGDEVYVEHKLNKSFLANIVFNDKEKLAILNSIVHPEVFNHLDNFINSNLDKEYILYENAILFENGSDKLCDKIITVTAPKKVKINRIIKRDNSTKNEVLQRMNNQWLEEKKAIQSNYIVHNIELESTRKSVNKIHNILTKIKS